MFRTINLLIPVYQNCICSPLWIPFLNGSLPRDFGWENRLWFSWHQAVTWSLWLICHCNTCSVENLVSSFLHNVKSVLCRDKIETVLSQVTWYWSLYFFSHSRSSLWRWFKNLATVHKHSDHFIQFCGTGQRYLSFAQYVDQNRNVHICTYLYAYTYTYKYITIHIFLQHKVHWIFSDM